MRGVKFRKVVKWLIAIFSLEVDSEESSSSSKDKRIAC